MAAIITAATTGGTVERTMAGDSAQEASSPGMRLESTIPNTNLPGARAAIRQRNQASRMKVLLAIAVVGEAATGLVLLVYPPIVLKLLFGAEVTGAGVLMSRICGISLIALGLACWPARVVSLAPLRGMLTYSSLATLYLFCLGVSGQWTGTLLWSAIAVHLILTIFLAWAWFNERKAVEANRQKRETK